MRVVIIGAGVIGQTTAWYLRKEGIEVTIIDKTDGLNNCSYGNAGYISPSHFVPLASPGIVAQGLKWMLDSASPFYIKPRWDKSLLKWGYQFYKNANSRIVSQNIPHLHHLLQLSRYLTEELNCELKGGFDLENKGCFMLYRNHKTEHHEKDLACQAQKLGIETHILSGSEVQNMEPHVEVKTLGGVYYPNDCHLHPGKMMKTLRQANLNAGVKMVFDQEVVGFETNGPTVTSAITQQGKFDCDYLVVAVGAWLEVLSTKLGIHILLQPGKGYSTTYQNINGNLTHPAILVDDRVALTPWDNKLRVGGTMELSGINQDVNMNRVRPIIAAANKYYPTLHLTTPAIGDVWSGLRPCSPDGLPYIGKSPYHINVSIAGGHAMLGISLAAGTGYLIKQLVQKEETEIAMDAFRLVR